MEYLGLNEAESVELIKRTVKLAHKARDKYLIEKNIKNEGICYNNEFVFKLVPNNNLYDRKTLDCWINWTVRCPFA